MTPDESKAFGEGKAIKRLSGDRFGNFTVTVKLTRPRKSSRRFPEATYGKDYRPAKNPPKARIP